MKYASFTQTYSDKRRSEINLLKYDNIENLLFYILYMVLSPILFCSSCS